MNRLLVLLFLILLGSVQAPLCAQKAPKKGWKKLMKEAEEFEKLGDLGRAALYYESAYRQKEDKKILIYRAGDCYLETRDYANAVKCLEEVKEVESDEEFVKPGFKYALALKQTGTYQAAKDAFNSFIEKYNGPDKELMRETVETEILGCNFALKAQEYTNPNISIQHLDPNVNTDKTEFAPIPFNDYILYFSSTVSGVSKIYRTEKNNTGTWMTRQVPPIFTGKMEKPHYGNGTFTPDGKRFFFTQCDLVEGGKPKCAIYIMAKENGVWPAPIKLPEYINQEGANTTHPYVTIIGEKEVLYFASDREGGKGGLDLWYCTRDLSSTGNNFTLPKNLGHNINTPGDEISPHYHYPTKMLYFSSNGRISAGGFDVFKSKGEKMSWELAQNLGFPINSATDDLYFVVSDAHGGGYFVSNRKYEPEKVATSNDDIFYYGEEKLQVKIKGSVYADADPNKVPLKDVNIRLFDLSDGMEEMVQDRMFSVAEVYNFILESDKKYLLEVKAGGFEKHKLNISTEGVKEAESRTYDIAMKVPDTGTDIDPMYIVVPAKHSDRESAYKLPFEPPLDPETSEPYAEGTAVYKAFLIAEAVAEESDSREVFWNNKELTPLEDGAYVGSNNPPPPKPEIDPRYVVVPEEYNSKANAYELPTSVPINEETGEPYEVGSPVSKAFYKANETAELSPNREVYWDGETLAYVEPEPVISPVVEVDYRYVIVPEEYNDRENAYLLPTKLPIDPTTGEPYAEGSEGYAFYLEAKRTADNSDNGTLYWANEELLPHMGDVAVIDPGIEKPIETTPAAPKGVSYKIQVSAVRKYREYKYAELWEGPLAKYKMGFEAIDDGITRVLIIPNEKNEDGTIGFKTKSEALNVLSYIMGHTRFKSAFVNRYEDDERVGEGFRGLEESELQD